MYGQSIYVEGLLGHPHQLSIGILVVYVSRRSRSLRFLAYASKNSCFILFEELLVSSSCKLEIKKALVFCLQEGYILSVTLLEKSSSPDRLLSKLKNLALLVPPFFSLLLLQVLFYVHMNFKLSILQLNALGILNFDG